MNIEGEGYTVTYQDNTITIFGKLSLMLEDYEDIEVFFKNIVIAEPEELTLDIRNLEYLNSAGIKIICVNLILEAAVIGGMGMKILCSNRYTWQRETVPTFKGLMNNMQILFE